MLRPLAMTRRSTPMNPEDPQPVPLTAEGKFSVQSDFDIATNMPGTAGTVVNDVHPGDRRPG